MLHIRFKLNMIAVHRFAGAGKRLAGKDDNSVCRSSLLESLDFRLRQKLHVCLPAQQGAEFRKRRCEDRRIDHTGASVAAGKRRGRPIADDKQRLKRSRDQRQRVVLIFQKGHRFIRGAKRNFTVARKIDFPRLIDRFRALQKRK